ncbi:MAG TPA: hypothetical protein VHF22_01775 [Planctomycetota bacterium]|nr:hypothetical protein [Planctomycetota bacterium]
MPGNDQVVIKIAKDEKEERAQRADLVMHNAKQFVDMEREIPDLEDLKKQVKLVDAKFPVIAKQAGVRLNRSKRAMIYTLSGPAFSYAGMAIAGVIVGATNPFGWAVVGSAAAGWAMWKGGMKVWRNARASIYGERGVKALRDALESGTTTQLDRKFLKDDIDRARYWLQKRRLSRIADDCKVAFECGERFRGGIKIKRCYDMCLYAYDYFRLQKIGGKLLEDVAEFLEFEAFRRKVPTRSSRRTTRPRRSSRRSTRSRSWSTRTRRATSAARPATARRARRRAAS